MPQYLPVLPSSALSISYSSACQINKTVKTRIVRTLSAYLDLVWTNSNGTTSQTGFMLFF